MSSNKFKTLPTNEAPKLLTFEEIMEGVLPIPKLDRITSRDLVTGAPLWTPELDQYLIHWVVEGRNEISLHLIAGDLGYTEEECRERLDVLGYVSVPDPEKDPEEEDPNYWVPKSSVTFN